MDMWSSVCFLIEKCAWLVRLLQGSITKYTKPFVSLCLGAQKFIHSIGLFVLMSPKQMWHEKHDRFYACDTLKIIWLKCSLFKRIEPWWGARATFKDFANGNLNGETILQINRKKRSFVYVKHCFLKGF